MTFNRMDMDRNELRLNFSIKNARIPLGSQFAPDKRKLSTSHSAGVRKDVSFDPQVMELPPDPGRIARLRYWLRHSAHRYWALAVLGVLLALAWAAALSPISRREECLVICRQRRCGFAEIRMMDPKSIGEKHCRRCGGPLGFAWKCPNCDFEFPLVLSEIPPGTMSHEQELKLRLREWRCPNCGSSDCYQMGLEEFQKLHPGTGR